MLTILSFFDKLDMFRPVVFSREGWFPGNWIVDKKKGLIYSNLLILQEKIKFWL